jgi:hypothetical protein
MAEVDEDGNGHFKLCRKPVIPIILQSLTPYSNKVLKYDDSINKLIHSNVRQKEIIY